MTDVLRDVLTTAALLLLTLVAVAVGLLRRRPVEASVRPTPLTSVLGAGGVLLLVVVAAASASLLPFQLDGAGRQACAVTRSAPGPEQRAEALALAGRSDVQGVRDAAGPATPPSRRYAALERWCSSND